MKPRSRSRTFREIVGTLKLAGCIAAFVLAVLVIAYLCN